MTRDSADTAADGREDAELVAAARCGDEAAFAALSERYRHPLRVHCYRMLGSFDDAEEMVQETLLRAWRGLENFEARSLLRTWLYRIATNACLNALERSPKRVLPQDVAAPITAVTPASEARSAPRWAPELPWLQPYPDHLLELAVASELEPDALAVRRQSVELAFLAALQHLQPRQRAVLLLADVVGWSAADVAGALEVSVASITSSLQRARAALRTQLPRGRDDWSPNAPISEEQRTALKIFMDAWENGDVAALVERLCDDARWAMPPAALWFDGRAAIENLLQLYPPTWQGRHFRLLPVGANRQPAAAAYLRAAGDSHYRLSALHVLRVERGQIAEITTFSGALAAAFELAPVL